jgi:ribosomal protein L37AE/L43A
MRLKCHLCARYMSSKPVSGEIVKCNSCGQEYARLGEDSFQPMESKHAAGAG